MLLPACDAEPALCSLFLSTDLAYVVRICFNITIQWPAGTLSRHLRRGVYNFAVWTLDRLSQFGLLLWSTNLGIRGTSEPTPYACLPSVTASGSVLVGSVGHYMDCCALILIGLERIPPLQARMTFTMARQILVEMAYSFGVVRARYTARRSATPSGFLTARARPQRCRI